MKNKILKYLNLKNIVFILYMIITAITIYFHEYWRDEAQAWLIARDLSFIDIIKQMQYEGHPCLWHLILVPFAKLGFPFYTISIINWIIMVTTVWLILYKAKIDKMAKILFVGTSPILYFYPVIARSYSLMALLIVLISIMYEKRRKYPIVFGILLFLLTNTHVIAVAFTGMIFVTFYLKDILKDKKKDKKLIIGAIIALLGFIVLVLQIYNSLNLCIARKESINPEGYNPIYNYVGKAIGFFLGISDINISNAIVSFFMEISIVLFLILLLLKIPRDNKKEFIIITISFLYVFFIDIFLYCNLPQRSNILLLFLFFYFVNYKGKSKDMLDTIMLIISVLSIIMSIQVIISEIKYTYSNSKDVAKYIIDNCSENSIFVSDTPDLQLAIETYLDDYNKENNYRYYNLQTDEYYTFITWNFDIEAKIEEDAFFEKIESLQENKNVYFIHTKSSYDAEDGMELIIENMLKDGKLEKIYENLYTLGDENFVLYKITQIQYDN